MIDQYQFLRIITEKLDAAGVLYMVCGSMGAIAFGEPRTTNDVDIVLDLDRPGLVRFLGLLGSDFYVSPEAAEDALRRRSMFNVIHIETGWKADLMIRKNRPFELEEFSRRRMVDLRGVPVSMLSPEDAVLSKLEWNKISPSERQLRDVLGVAVTQWGRLDLPYLRRWADELGVREDLERVLKEAQEIHGPSD